MTVGLPGAGIGGLFYLLSALIMPFHALSDMLLRHFGVRKPAVKQQPWMLIWKQFTTAVLIVCSVWLTGLGLGALIISHPAALGGIQTAAAGRHLPNVLRMSVILASFGSLAVVLGAVQLARLVAVSNARRRLVEQALAKQIGAALLLMLCARGLSAQSAVTSESARHLSIADRAFAAEDTATARREYEAALAGDRPPTRAFYKLGQLSHRDPERAQSWFKKYVVAQPTDAWGWMALGDSYAAGRDFQNAISAYARAISIAPTERDAIVGRARVLAKAGRTDDAIVAYEAWTSTYPRDAEALQELGAQQRRAGRYAEAARTYELSNTAKASQKSRSASAFSHSFAAPAIELTTSGSGDSDNDKAFRVGGLASTRIANRTRLTLGGGRRMLTGYADVTIDDASLGLQSRPLASLRLEALGGIMRPRSTSFSTDTIVTPGTSRGRGKVTTPPTVTIIKSRTETVSNIFVGSVRGQWKQPGGRSTFDLRATRALLDATPVLVLNRVVRNEVAARADLGVLPGIKLRGGARAAAYDANGDTNSRLSLLTGLALSATDNVEVSGVFQQLTFNHATTSGYFAPRLAQLAEAATYSEFESATGVVLALDAGAGMQRLADFGQADIGKWQPSFRLFASLDVPMRPGSSFHFDVDSYDSRLGSDVPTASTSWRFLSASASVRIGLR